ncbi:RHS repeat-associated core domain-containing protein [Peribacillus simplex]|uniref:RHS repeat domain-containing protein n=1 Tax=Peribacillus simplex TaxID=1478 RepID=UPI001924CFD9|nr:RHS repeat-associated core domain-containing protein [Peribacillus simplex]MBD8591127.1 RHS repeat-associated core domain-containing protein [Peribacillus simplex]
MYDADDKLKEKNDSTGKKHMYAYDKNGNLLTSTFASGTSVIAINQSVDKNDQVTSISSGSTLESFTYTENDQLAGLKNKNGTFSLYDYDGAGLLTRLLTNNTSGSLIESFDYTYDAANQLSSINGTTITHDKNGNLTNDGKRILVYDAEDRLVEVKEGTTSVAKYQYNSEGLGISKTTGSTTVNYTYDENANVVLETDQSGAVLASYVYDNGNRPLTMTKSGKTYTFHANAHGDITSVTDAAGTVVACFEYDAWGNQLKESGNFTSLVPFRYAGYRYDSETKLYYLQQRYYNSEIGRFLTLDPQLGEKENPITQKSYSYAE